MGAEAAVVFLGVAVFGWFPMRSPRRFWWKAAAWMYRYPKANEPSDTMYVCYRVLGVVLVIVGCVGAAHGFTQARADYREQHANDDLSLFAPHLDRVAKNVPMSSNAVVRSARLCPGPTVA